MNDLIPEIEVAAHALDTLCEAAYKMNSVAEIRALMAKINEVADGHYYLKDAIQTHLIWQMQCLSPKTDRYTGRVYVIEYGNGTVKIGSTINPKQRLSGLGGGASSPIVRHFFSPRMADHAKLERWMHVRFEEFRTHGEFFTVSFDDAIQELQEQFAFWILEDGRAA